MKSISLNTVFIIFLGLGLQNCNKNSSQKSSRSSVRTSSSLEADTKHTEDSFPDRDSAQAGDAPSVLIEPPNADPSQDNKGPEAQDDPENPANSFTQKLCAKLGPEWIESKANSTCIKVNQSLSAEELCQQNKPEDENWIFVESTGTCERVLENPNKQQVCAKKGSNWFYNDFTETCVEFKLLQNGQRLCESRFGIWNSKDKICENPLSDIDVIVLCEEKEAQGYVWISSSRTCELNLKLASAKKLCESDPKRIWDRKNLACITDYTQITDAEACQQTGGDYNATTKTCSIPFSLKIPEAQCLKLKGTFNPISKRCLFSEGDTRSLTPEDACKEAGYVWAGDSCKSYIPVDKTKEECQPNPPYEWKESGSGQCYEVQAVDNASICTELGGKLNEKGDCETKKQPPIALQGEGLCLAAGHFWSTDSCQRRTVTESSEAQCLLPEKVWQGSQCYKVESMPLSEICTDLRGTFHEVSQSCQFNKTAFPSPLSLEKACLIAGDSWMENTCFQLYPSDITEQASCESSATTQWLTSVATPGCYNTVKKENAEICNALGGVARGNPQVCEFEAFSTVPVPIDLGCQILGPDNFWSNGSCKFFAQTTSPEADIPKHSLTPEATCLSIGGQLVNTDSCALNTNNPSFPIQLSYQESCSTLNYDWQSSPTPVCLDGDTPISLEDICAEMDVRKNAANQCEFTSKILTYKQLLAISGHLPSGEDYNQYITEFVVHEGATDQETCQIPQGSRVEIWTRGKCISFIPSLHVGKTEQLCTELGGVKPLGKEGLCSFAEALYSPSEICEEFSNGVASSNGTCFVNYSLVSMEKECLQLGGTWNEEEQSCKDLNHVLTTLQLCKNAEGTLNQVEDTEKCLIQLDGSYDPKIICEEFTKGVWLTVESNPNLTEPLCASQRVTEKTILELCQELDGYAYLPSKEQCIKLEHNDSKSTKEICEAKNDAQLDGQWVFSNNLCEFTASYDKVEQLCEELKEEFDIDTYFDPQQNSCKHVISSKLVATAYKTTYSHDTYTNDTHDLHYFLANKIRLKKRDTLIKEHVQYVKDYASYLTHQEKAKIQIKLNYSAARDHANESKNQKLEAAYEEARKKKQKSRIRTYSKVYLAYDLARYLIESRGKWYDLDCDQGSWITDIFSTPDQSISFPVHLSYLRIKCKGLDDDVKTFSVGNKYRVVLDDAGLPVPDDFVKCGDVASKNEDFGQSITGLRIMTGLNVETLLINRNLEPECVAWDLREMLRVRKEQEPAHSGNYDGEPELSGTTLFDTFRSDSQRNSKRLSCARWGQKNLALTGIKVKILEEETGKEILKGIPLNADEKEIDLPLLFEKNIIYQIKGRCSRIEQKDIVTISE